MNKKQIIINLLASVVVFAVQMVISFWLSPYILEQVGEEAYGFLNLANSFVSYASLIVVAINSMASRFISVEYNKGNIKEAKEFFVSVFLINCVLAALMLIFSGIIVLNLEHVIHISEELVLQVKWTFLFSFMNMGVSFIGTAYAAAAFVTNKMHLNSAVQIVSNVTKSVLVLVLFLVFPAKIYLLSIATLVAGVTTLIGNYILTKRLLDDFDIHLSLFDIKKIIILIKSGVWMLISNISNLLLNGLDLLITNQMISGILMGRLSVAKLLPTALASMLNYFSSVFTASLTQTFAKDTNQRLLEESLFQLRMLGFIFTVPFAGIVVYGSDFLGLWLAKYKYSAGDLRQIYILMLITLADIAISTYMYSVHSVFMALNKVKVYAITLLISSILSAGITFVLVKDTALGVYAVAGTSVAILGITHAIIVPGYAGVLLKQNVAIYWMDEIRAWISLLALCGVFFAISHLFEIDSWGSFVIVVAINGLIGYMLSFLVILKKEEKQFFINKLTSKLVKK